MISAQGGVASQCVNFCEKELWGWYAPALPLPAEPGDWINGKWHHSPAVLTGWLTVHLISLA